MSRLVRPAIDLEKLPTSISASVRAVLEEHNLVLVRAGDTQNAWDGDRLNLVLAEIGRNVAGVVAMTDDSSEVAA